jgi:hypothetical protein
MKVRSWWLGCSMVGMLACGGSKSVVEAPTPAVQSAKPATAELSRELAAAISVRKLEPRAEVPLRELPRSALAGELRSAIERDVPAERIKGESLFLKILGLVAPDFDYVAASVDMLQAELAGFYDSETKSMVLAEGLDANMRQETLVHELVHALQDQHFGLGASLKRLATDTDAASALHALAEGDATSAMLDATLAAQGYHSTELGDDVLIARMRAAFRKAMPGVPGILRRSALAPYTDGLLFVNELRRSGGWDLVNATWANPPTTTEQLLHPMKLAAREKPRTIGPASGPTEGCKERLREQIGEQGLRLILEEWHSEDDAEGAAAGWNGDLAQVFECGSQHALFWRVAFDDTVQASAGIEALRAGLGHCRREPLGVRMLKISGDVVVAGALVGPGATCEQLSDWLRLSL